MIKLPKKMRPVGGYRKFIPGLDLPSWFWYGLKGIDEKFFLVYHKYNVMWDNIINDYMGPLDDPRFIIHNKYGEMNFGLVTSSSGDRSPDLDNHWHLWRMCDPHGWAHIVRIEDTHGQYLKLLLNRLHLQGRFSDRYGHLAWTRKLDDDSEEVREKMQRDREDLHRAVQEENKWLMRRVKDNFERGITAPTRPQKETVFSAPGINHRSTLRRDLTDEEGGLIVPEE